MNLKSLLREKLLNLPPEQASAPAGTKAVPSGQGQGRAGGGASVWAAAAEQAQRRSDPESPAVSSSEGQEEGAPWRPIATDPASQKWKKTVRWMTVAVLALFLWIGIRSTFFDSGSSQVAGVSGDAAHAFPSAQAAGTASQFALAFLSWDEEKPEARAAAMHPWYASGQATARLGWDGKGKQAATNAVVLQVVPQDAETARVLVQVTVSETQRTKSAKGKLREATLPARTVVLEMKVKATDQGSAVFGVPGVVAAPAPVDIDRSKDVLREDSALSTATQKDAEKFFQAFITQTDLSSITAPGSRVRGLGGVYQKASLKEWKVNEGDGGQRTARATVEFTTPGGVVTTQTFQVQLTRVSGGAADKWQVSNINGTN